MSKSVEYAKKIIKEVPQNSFPEDIECLQNYPP